MVLEIFKLPLLFVLFVMNLFWIFSFGFITLFCKMSMSVPFLRPVSFVLALPFLLFGDIIITLSPAPSIADASSKLEK